MFLLAIPQSLERVYLSQTQLVDPVLVFSHSLRYGLFLPAYGQLRLDETGRNEPFFPCLQQPQIYEFQ